MSIRVSCIKKTDVRIELKRCPKIIQDYVAALESSNSRWEYLNKKAMEKLRESQKPHS